MRRQTWVLALLLAVVGLVPTAAIAQEDGPVVTLSEDTDVLIGQEIDVTVEGFPGGSTVSISTCWTFPVASPNDCELSDFGQYSITTAGDGSGTDIYVLPAAPAERCTADDECFIVVSLGIGPEAVFGGAPVAYALEQPEPTTTTTEATTTTTTTVPETTTTVPETTTTVEETTTTEADTTTTTEEPEEEAEGISTGAIVIIVLLAVGAGLVGFFVARNRGAGE